jgi:hypothetical protein
MKTKLTILCTLLFIAAILLGGCSGESAATVSASNGLSTATRLALGTLKLEGTDQAVTVSQGTELLTLWQGYQSLSSSDTASAVELDALEEQIQSTMTAEQIKAIDALDLTDQSVSDLMQSLGDSASASAPASTPNASALSQSAPMGDGPGGMPGGGGDSVMSEIGNGMTTQSTAAVTQSVSNIQTTQVDGRLLNALIQILAMRSQTTG